MLSSCNVDGGDSGVATAMASGWPSKLLIDLAFTTPSFILFLLVNENDEGGGGDDGNGDGGGDGDGFFSSFSTTTMFLGVAATNERLRTLFMLRRRPLPK